MYGSIEERDDLIKRFLLVLEKNNEEAVHSFIISNPQLLAPIAGFAPCILSKYKFGDEFIPDFVAVGRHPSSNIGATLTTLVEIESPVHKLFTRSGDTTAALTHAIRQTRDWRNWIKQNRAYFVSRLGEQVRERCHRGFSSRMIEQYIVVIGRQHTLSESDKNRLATILDEEKTIVFTYDALIDFTRDPILSLMIPFWRRV